MALGNNLPPTVDYSALPPTVDPGPHANKTIERAPISKGMSIRGRNGASYLVLEPLGEPGAQADVYLTRKHNEVYVLKMYHGGFEPCEQAVDILERDECAHIAKLVERGIFNHSFYFEVFHHYSSGTLADWIAQGRCTQTFIKRTLLPSLDDALHYLHEHELVHGDIKPANIFIDSNNQSVVLGDFGVASVLPKGQQTISFRGTLEYAPPVRHEGNQVAIGPAYDYGALGLVLFESYTGHSPFAGKTLAERDAAWLTFDVSDFQQIPLEASRLISGLLHRDETARFGHEQCQAFLDKKGPTVRRGAIRRDRSYRPANSEVSAPTLELGFVDGKIVIARDLASILRFCELNWNAAIPILNGDTTGKLGLFLKQVTGSDDFFSRWVGRFSNEPADERLFILCAAIRERCEGRESHGFIFKQTRYRSIIHLLENIRDGLSADAWSLLCGDCLPEYLALFGYGRDVSNQVHDAIALGGSAPTKADKILAFCRKAPDLVIGGRRIESIHDLLAELMCMTISEIEQLAIRPELASWLYVHNCPYVLSELESFHE